MVNQSKREYWAAILGRYRRAGRKFKQMILDEFCSICGYRRKHAIRLLRRRGVVRQEGGAKGQYGPEVVEVLKDLWLASDGLCAKRLKAAIPVGLPFYRPKCELPKDVCDRLLRVSPATLDRLLKPVRKQYGTRGRCGTRPGTLFRHQIPSKTDRADITQPGYVEADTVAHCGNSLDGNFVWSLTLSDILAVGPKTGPSGIRAMAASNKPFKRSRPTCPSRCSGFKPIMAENSSITTFIGTSQNATSLSPLPAVVLITKMIRPMWS